MHTTLEDALTLANGVRVRCSEVRSVEVVLIPPFTWIVPLAEHLRGSGIGLGAQTCSAFVEGPYTGEISARMLAPFCQYVIVGHSERRRLFGETDAVVAAKLQRVLQHGMRAILCVGETLEERDRGETLDVIDRQLATACETLSQAEFERIVVAYEPVWAIGTGRPAMPSDAQQVAAWIRAWFDRRTRGSGASLRILYGGSVTAENAGAFFAEPDIDGALVGGASLDAEGFSRIVQAAVTHGVV